MKDRLLVVDRVEETRPLPERLGVVTHELYTNKLTKMAHETPCRIPENYLPTRTKLVYPPPVSFAK